MHIVIKGGALEKFFSEVADAFYSIDPAYAEQFAGWVREATHSLRNTNAMSEGGEHLLLGYFPPGLYGFIKKQAHKRLRIDDVWRDPANIRLFFKVWRTASVARRRTLRLFKQEPLVQCPASQLPS